jgi:ribosomal protein S26
MGRSCSIHGRSDECIQNFFQQNVMEISHLEDLDLSAVVMNNYILNKECVKDVDWNR